MIFVVPDLPMFWTFPPMSCSAGTSLCFLHYSFSFSCPINENTASIFGLPTPSSWVPSLEADASDKMSFYDRFKNVIRQNAASLIIGKGSVEPLNAIFRKYYGFVYGNIHGMFVEYFSADFPDIMDTIKNSPLIFVNVDELLDFPRPIFSNIVYIGGLEIENMQNQEAELEVSVLILIYHQ